jgi:hypothetical protein
MNSASVSLLSSDVQPKMREEGCNRLDLECVPKGYIVVFSRGIIRHELDTWIDMSHDLYIIHWRCW